MINRVILVGRLTKNPEIRKTPNGASICKFTLAVSRKVKAQGQPDADFISCVAFGRNGEFAEKYFHQGMRVSISGRIQTGSYTNKDGVKVYTTEVIVEEQEFAESKAASGQTSGGGYQPAGRPEPSNAGAEGFMSIPEGIEDDLPFK